jgi:hypothetical protein
MSSSERDIVANVEMGRPTVIHIAPSDMSDLNTYVDGAQEASLEVHTALYQDFADGNPQIVRFGEEGKGQKDAYISYKDHDGIPLFGDWDPTNTASDIGVRGVNPDFRDLVNPVTVVHADTLAIKDFKERGAPQTVLDAIDAVGRLNEFVEDAIARPYLEQVAEAFGADKEAYLANFFAKRRERRQRIVTRVIMYHLDATPGQRPVGSDGAPLLIREHKDRSSWTFDVRQTASGLQYFVDGIWQDAGTDIAAFRGTADSYLPIEAEVPGTVHRAVVRDFEPEERLKLANIGRIAIPTFVSPIHDNARVVVPSSSETHPMAN